MSDLATALIAGVPRRSPSWVNLGEMLDDEHGEYVVLGHVLAALSVALDAATAERAGEVVTRLNARTVKRLPDNWQEGRKCPDCGVDAARPKCLWDHGPSCARHDPDAYDPPAWEVVPDRDCKIAADLITALIAQNAALRRAGKRVLDALPSSVEEINAWVALRAALTTEERHE